MKPKYNTWVRKKKMMLFILMFFFLIIISFFISNILIKILFLFVAIPFGYISIILLTSYYYFSKWGKNYQEIIHNKIVNKINIEGNVSILDIGAGSGSLSIKTAKKNKKFKIKAIDYWGNNWEYSKNQCINNSVVELVDKQIEFMKASASKIPFENNTFDVVISCLTFHEVKDTENKNKVISEAIRVLKSGGQFIFFDLFYNEKIFGNFNDFINNIKKDNVDILEIENMETAFIECPKTLLHKKVLGYGVFIVGKKL